MRRSGGSKEESCSMTPKWMEVFKDEIDERVETAVKTAVETAIAEEHEKTIVSLIRSLMKNMKWKRKY